MKFIVALLFVIAFAASMSIDERNIIDDISGGVGSLFDFANDINSLVQGGGSDPGAVISGAAKATGDLFKAAEQFSHLG